MNWRFAVVLIALLLMVSGCTEGGVLDQATDEQAAARDVKATIERKNSETHERELEAFAIQAQQFELEGDWINSIDLYLRALSASRTEDRYMLFLGRALIEQAKNAPSDGVYKLAQNADFEQVLALTQTDVSQMARSDLLRAAEIVLQEAKRVDPFNTDHAANLARLYRTWADLMGDNTQLHQALLAKCIAAYERALQLSPDTAYLWNEKGNTHLVYGDNDLAEAAYKHSLAVDPRYDQTYLLMADFYDRTQQPDKAVELLLRGIEELPDNEQLYAYLGVALARQGDLEGAIDANLVVLDLQPNNRGTMYNLAVLYRDTGDIGQAISWIEKAIAATDTADVGQLKILKVLADQLYQTQRTTEKD